MSDSSDRRDGSGGRDVRAAAVEIVERLLSSGHPATALLSSAQARTSERDSALLNELVLGTLRWRRRLASVLEAASGRPIRRIDRRLQAPLLVGLYQLLMLDRVPAYAAVDLAVSTARRRGGRRAAGFVNAVLRRVAGSCLDDWPVVDQDPVRRLGIEHSHPDLLVAGWLKRFGSERTVRLLEVNNRPRALHLLAFRDHGGRDALRRRLAGEGVETVESDLSPLGLVVTAGDPIGGEAFRRGEFYVQDAASQAAALLPPPRPDERILDAAAAPGGKSFAMIAWEPACRLLALELQPRRLASLAINLGRLGRRFPIVAASALQPPFTSRFDRVVLDLPCSGTGVLRKHPELKWRISGPEIERLARGGLDLVATSSELVDDGGLLIIVTCSIEPQENERIVERFLRRDSRFALVALEDEIPAQLRGGIEGRGRWRVLPGVDRDGFTAHVLRRG